MRGYFAIGVEGISKPMNVGNLFRSAYAFGASFVFTLNADQRALNMPSDTGRSSHHMPAYEWRDLSEMALPDRCQLVGVELLDEAIDLPSFHHPAQAAYVLGPERDSLSPELLEKCDFTIKIPTRFCINVAVAGAIVMYDRMTSMGRFAPRPMRPGPPQELTPHRHGGIYRRNGQPRK